MEKTLRVLGGEEGESGHAHGHSHAHGPELANVHTTGVAAPLSASGLRPRAGAKPEDASVATSAPHEPKESPAKPSKLSAYLNLFGDFVHNM